MIHCHTGINTILLEPAFGACKNAKKRGLNVVVCGILSENDVNDGSVPACKCLWSSEDDSAGHFRRYNYRNLKETVEQCGFTVKYENYFFEFAFLPILLVRVFLEKIGILKSSSNRTKEEKKKVSEKQFKERKGIVGGILNMCETVELKRLMKGSKVRFGSSLICIIQKNENN